MKSVKNPLISSKVPWISIEILISISIQFFWSTKLDWNGFYDSEDWYQWITDGLCIIDHWISIIIDINGYQWDFTGLLINDCQWWLTDRWLVIRGSKKTVLELAPDKYNIWPDYNISLTWIVRPFNWGWFPWLTNRHSPGFRSNCEVVMNFTQINGTLLEIKGF